MWASSWKCSGPGRSPLDGGSCSCPGQGMEERSFKGELWVLPSPPPGHPPAATLRRCLGRATVPKVFSQKHPGVVQAESAVGIRPAATLEDPLDTQIPHQTHCLPPSASAFSKPSALNTMAWQCPGHSHCGIWPPPVWGQLITSIWRYRLLNLSLLAKDLLFLLNFHRSLQRNSRSQRLRLESAFPARAGFARLL